MENNKRIFDLLIKKGYTTNDQITSDKAINDIIEVMEQVKIYNINDVNNENKNNILEAIELLKDNNIEEIQLCRFGIYQEVELAGYTIRCEVLSYKPDNINDDVYEQLYDLLEFIDEDYITDVLGYNKEGQNTLLLTHNGFKIGEFRV